MANKVTGWQGSGTRPGSRRRKEGKGTVYWIDLGVEKDEVFRQFAEHHGMERREAAKALMLIAMGYLPPHFWDPEERDENGELVGGFSGPQRMNLVRTFFPKGSGHTNRAPHAVWKATYDSGRHPEMAGAPGGISWIGLMMEREKDRLKRLIDIVGDEADKKGRGKDGRRTIKRGVTTGWGGYPPGEDREKARKEYEERAGLEMEEYQWLEARDHAREQLRIAEERDRLHRLERGIIDDRSLGGTRSIDRQRPTGDDVDPYSRERRKHQEEVDAARTLGGKSREVMEADPEYQERAERKRRIAEGRRERGKALAERSAAARKRSNQDRESGS